MLSKIREDLGALE